MFVQSILIRISPAISWTYSFFLLVFLNGWKTPTKLTHQILDFSPKLKKRQLWRSFSPIFQILTAKMNRSTRLLMKFWTRLMAKTFLQRFFFVLPKVWHFAAKKGWVFNVFWWNLIFLQKSLYFSNQNHIKFIFSLNQHSQNVRISSKFCI